MRRLWHTANGGRIDKCDAGAAALAGVEIPAQGDQGPGHQLDKAAVADEGREVRAQLSRHIRGVVMFEVAIVATMEVHDDRHELAQRQGRLASALELTALQQPLQVQRLKPLAKVIDFTEHSNESTHGGPP